jgi:hypothetical protein
MARKKQSKKRRMTKKKGGARLPFKKGDPIIYRDRDGQLLDGTVISMKNKEDLEIKLDGSNIIRDTVMGRIIKPNKRLKSSNKKIMSKKARIANTKRRQKTRRKELVRKKRGIKSKSKSLDTIMEDLQL